MVEEEEIMKANRSNTYENVWEYYENELRNDEREPCETCMKMFGNMMEINEEIMKASRMKMYENVWKHDET